MFNVQIHNVQIHNVCAVAHNGVWQDLIFCLQQGPWVKKRERNKMFQKVLYRLYNKSRELDNTCVRQLVFVFVIVIVIVFVLVFVIIDCQSRNDTCGAAVAISSD